MLGKLRDVWGRWRESRRQHQLERALYKAGGNPTGMFGPGEQVERSIMASGAEVPRVEAPKRQGARPEG
jgi:hypothetical protein